MIGQVLDSRYRLERLLGQGGMGAVYEATHIGTGRRVAVKVILDIALGESDVFGRFQREARASSRIETRHVVSVLDSGRDAATNTPFLAMELLRGEDLGELLEGRMRLDPSLAIRVVGQAAIGLSKAHLAGIVHRDIKPANLFLCDAPETSEAIVKVLDFGIAKIRKSPLGDGDLKLTQTGRLLGTPLYMSPEQAQGEADIDARSDLWSLGAVLYECVTGASPFGHAENLGKLILAICSKPPPPPREINPDLPIALSTIIERCLCIDRDRRFQSAAELHEALLGLTQEGFAIARTEFWNDRPPELGLSRSRNGVSASGRAVIRPLGSVHPVDETSVASTMFATAAPATGPRRHTKTAAAVVALGGLVVASALFVSRSKEGSPAHGPASEPSAETQSAARSAAAEATSAESAPPEPGLNSTAVASSAQHSSASATTLRPPPMTPTTSAPTHVRTQPAPPTTVSTAVPAHAESFE